MVKKLIGVTIGILTATTLVLAIIPTTRDEIHWRWATHKDETTSYQSYVKTWPTGRHASEAKIRSENRCWKDAQNAGTVQGFKLYVKLHGDGKHVAEAQELIESLRWQEATATNTVRSFEDYLQLHRDGKHVAEAQELIESLTWQKAIRANTTWGFEDYLQLHPDGKHVAEAQELIESLRWQVAIRASTAGGFEHYLKLHRDGKHVAEAQELIESLRWQEATRANTIRSYGQYILAHPQGRYIQEADAKVAALRTDNTPFDTAMKVGTEASLKAFLVDFPGHQKEIETQQAIKDITEGRDIVDLLRETKIEIETSGSGINSVSVRIRRLVPYPVTVRVPVGSYFVSARQSAQNMVTTAEKKIHITDDGWHSLSVSAACANRPRDIPGEKDTFTVERSPHQEELARLMPVLQMARVSQPTLQAAVWIVTDNATYSDLGVLVSRPAYQQFGGTRTILVVHEQLMRARRQERCKSVLKWALTSLRRESGMTARGFLKVSKTAN